MNLIKNNKNGRSMKALITGAAGFIGSHLLEEIGGIGIDNYSTGQFIDTRIIRGDIRTFNFNDLPQIDIIFHVAAKASIPESLKNPYDSHDNTVNGGLKVLEFARRRNIPIVYSGSSSVYDDEGKENPVSPYALQKYIIEQYLQLYNKIFGLKSVILRYFSVYGERQPDYNSYQTVNSIFLKQKKEGNPFTITGTGEQRRDFIYVKDVVKANIKAVEYVKTVKKVEIFDIGSGVNYSINEVADMIKINHPRKFISPRIEPFITLCDYSKAHALLNWQPSITLPKWIQSFQ